ncbi:MAG: hypothetical protein J6L24_00070 [Oscillospiraceae bacterium]|nr:hypothetical protein [Oscillospiraceae bacterium]
MICLDFNWQIDEFWVYCRIAQLRPRTMKNYEQTLRLFERRCLEQMEITTVKQQLQSKDGEYFMGTPKSGKNAPYSLLRLSLTLYDRNMTELFSAIPTPAFF